MSAVLSAPAALVASPRPTLTVVAAPARKSRPKQRRKSQGPKQPRPFFRKFDGWWYVESPDFVALFGKRQVKLARGLENEAAAWVKYEEIMGQLAGAIATKALPPDAQRIDQLANDYLEWHASQNYSRNRSRNVNRTIKSFCRLCGANTAAEFAEVALSAFDKWVKAHKGWKSDSGQRTHIKIVKAFFNWCCRHKNLSRNPLAAYKEPAEVSRVTIFDAEQEAALLAKCNPAYRRFLSACIATGGRPLSEVASVEARHVVCDESGKPVAWDLGRANKNGRKGKDRVIYLTPEMSALTSELMAVNSTGPLFRNKFGNPIAHGAAEKWFRDLRPVVNKDLPPHKQLGPDYVLYSARHTFIVRQLIRTGGDVALVAEMAGNTIEVIDKHYKKWGKQRGRILDALSAG